jgi:hypothetical protein
MCVIDTFKSTIMVDRMKKGSIRTHLARGIIQWIFIFLRNTGLFWTRIGDGGLITVRHNELDSATKSRRERTVVRGDMISIRQQGVHASNWQ